MMDLMCGISIRTSRNISSLWHRHPSTHCNNMTLFKSVSGALHITRGIIKSEGTSAMDTAFDKPRETLVGNKHIMWRLEAKIEGDGTMYEVSCI